MPCEFDLIRRYFAHSTESREDVPLGIGDDCALLKVPPDRWLAVSSDTLVAGRHFLPGVDPETLGHKALAVNLSDLAAMGAEPAWASLCLTLPEVDEAWVVAFMRGFSVLAARHGVQLVGGDTTRGPLSISVTIHGLADPAHSLRRDAARPGDLVYVSGTLGDAGLALLTQQGLYTRSGSLRFLRQRLDRPEPRVELGLAAAPLAHAAIDLSDGLGGDLAHVCMASGAGAMLYLDRLPLSPAVRDYVDESGDWSLPLSAGDDYELLLTVPGERQAVFEAAMREQVVPVTWVGMIENGTGVRAQYPDGQIDEAVAKGYDHFAG